MKVKISPSILSADFANLESQIRDLEISGADMIHIDVMDGHFVPNITIGPCVIKSIRAKTSLMFDVHLMIENPFKYLKNFTEAGADIITIHYEATDDVLGVLKEIKKLGCKAGLSVMPSTNIENIYPFLKDCDLILIMTVMPGFGGQSFMHDQLEKIQNLSNEIKTRNLSVMIEVDGGINDETSKLVIKAGANVLVSGSYIFGSSSIKDAIKKCRGDS